MNLGLRYDHSKAYLARRGHARRARATRPGAISPAVDDLFTWNIVLAAPRLQLQAHERRQTVLKAHYGRYYRGDGHRRVRRRRASVLRALLVRGHLRRGRAIPTASSWSPTTRNLRVDPEFKNPYTDQFIVGVERELARTSGSR